jgi:hypothetical protein
LEPNSERWLPSCELPKTVDGGGSAGVKEAAEDGGGPAGVVDGPLAKSAERPGLPLPLRDSGVDGALESGKVKAMAGGPAATAADE